MHIIHISFQVDFLCGLYNVGQFSLGKHKMVTI